MATCPEQVCRLHTEDMRPAAAGSLTARRDQLCRMTGSNCAGCTLAPVQDDRLELCRLHTEDKN